MQINYEYKASHSFSFFVCTSTSCCMTDMERNMSGYNLRINAAWAEEHRSSSACLKLYLNFWNGSFYHRSKWEWESNQIDITHNHRRLVGCRQRLLYQSEWEREAEYQQINMNKIIGKNYHKEALSLISRLKIDFVSFQPTSLLGWRNITNSMI